MRTRVWGKSVGSGVASRWEQFLRPEVRPLTSGKETIRLVSAALLMSLAGCGGNKSHADGNDLGQAHAAVGNTGGGAKSATPPHNKQAENSGTMAAEEIAPMPEQNTGLGHLTRLNGSGIRTRLVGHMIMPDRRVRQANLEFAEDFLPDGTWVSRRNQRTRIVKRGAWRIVEDYICVTETDRPTLCRRVWADPSDRIAMRDMGTSIEIILIMSASLIR